MVFGLGKPDIEKMKRKHNVRGLFKLVVENKGEDGKMAQKALVDIGPDAIETMGKIMGTFSKSKSESENHPISEFVEVVSAMGPAAIDPLADSLSVNELYSYFYLITLTLCAIGDSEVIDKLKRFSDVISKDGKSISIKYIANRFIENPSEIQARIPLLLQMQRNYISAGSLLDSPSFYNGKLNLYKTMLSDKQTDKNVVNMRIYYTGLLGIIGDIEAIPILVNLINDKNPRIQKASALALGLIGTQAAIEPLTQHLNDRNHAVNHAASLSLNIINADPQHRVDAPIKRVNI